MRRLFSPRRGGARPENGQDQEPVILADELTKQAPGGVPWPFLAIAAGFVPDRKLPPGFKIRFAHPIKP
jgi:hypothetical protein